MVRIRTWIVSGWFWVGVILLAVGSLALWFWADTIRLALENLAQMFSQTEALMAFVDRLGWAGPLALITINALQIIVAPLPNYAIFVVAGLLYGPIWGGIYGLAGMLLGGVGAMLLTRRFGRPLAERMVGGERLDRWDGMQATQSILSWSILFLAPVGDLPFFLAGLAHVGVAKIAAISAITRGPTIFLIATASSGVTGMTWSQLVLVILALVVIFGLLAYHQQSVLDWFDQHVQPRFLQGDRVASNQDAHGNTDTNINKTNINETAAG